MSAVLYAPYATGKHLEGRHSVQWRVQGLGAEVLAYRTSFVTFHTGSSDSWPSAHQYWTLEAGFRREPKWDGAGEMGMGGSYQDRMKWELPGQNAPGLQVIM